MRTHLLLLLALVAGLSASHAQESPYPPGGIGSVATLLATDRAAQYVGLTARQKDTLAAVRTQYRDAARQIVAKADATPQARLAARSQLHTLTQSSNRRALQVLTPSQRERLRALEHRYLGPTLLFLPEVQSQLRFTPAQSERIAVLKAEAESRASAINAKFEAGELTPHQRRAQLRSDRRTREAKLLGVLTAEQRRQFQAWREPGA